MLSSVSEMQWKREHMRSKNMGVRSQESGCHQGRRGKAGLSPEHWARLRDSGRIRTRRRLCSHPPWAVVLWTRTGVLKLLHQPQQVWDGTQNFAFLTSSEAVPVVLLPRSHHRNQWTRTRALDRSRPT